MNLDFLLFADCLEGMVSLFQDDRIYDLSKSDGSKSLYGVFHPVKLLKNNYFKFDFLKSKGLFSFTNQAIQSLIFILL